MSINPLFSVLVANYNNGQYLEETLESIFNQTYANWEIVIVDDASTDHSLSIYEKLKDKSKIRIIYNDKNRGVGYTKKRCIEEAKGEICGFVDPDDKIAEMALETMVSAHLKNPNCSLIHSKLYYCDENMNVEREYQAGKQVEEDNPLFCNVDGEITAFSTFKKSLYDKGEALNSELKKAIDQDLYLKLYEVGSTLFLDQALYYYRIHKGGISTLNNAGKARYSHWKASEEALKRRGQEAKIEDVFQSFFIDTNKHMELMGGEKERIKILEAHLRRLKFFREIDRFFQQVKQKFSK